MENKNIRIGANIDVIDLRRAKVRIQELFSNRIAQVTGHRLGFGHDETIRVIGKRLGSEGKD